MGCDIHIVLERRDPGSEWIGLWCSDTFPGGRPKIAQRDYAFFGEVAQVRCRSETGKYPRNIPRDVSRLAWMEYMDAPTDHHSASHMTISEFTDAWFRANEKHPAVIADKNLPRREFAAYDLLGLSAYGDPDCKSEFRVVFWFDN